MGVATSPILREREGDLSTWTAIDIDEITLVYVCDSNVLFASSCLLHGDHTQRKVCGSKLRRIGHSRVYLIRSKQSDIGLWSRHQRTCLMHSRLLQLQLPELLRRFISHRAVGWNTDQPGLLMVFARPDRLIRLFPIAETNNFDAYQCQLLTASRKMSQLCFRHTIRRSELWGSTHKGTDERLLSSCLFSERSLDSVCF